MGRRAFTLLELLAVITVIVVLASLLLPTMKRAQTDALGIQSSNNLRELAVASLAYVSENGRYVPASDRQNLHRWHGSRTSASAQFDPTTGYLSDYLGRSRRVTVCPIMARLLDKSQQTFEDGSGGYGYNEIYLGGMRDSITDKNGVYISLPATKVPHPSSVIMFATTAYARADGVQEYPFCEPPYWDFGYGPADSRPSPSLHFRVNGKALVAWCDGHITKETLQARDVGENPHGGDAPANSLGWFGPDKDNGYWNPDANISQ